MKPWSPPLDPSRYPGEVAESVRDIFQPKGPTLKHVRIVFLRRCCGYATRPDAEALARGLRREREGTACTEEERHAIDAWMHEATTQSIMQAWLDGAYRLDDLVRAVRKDPLRHADRELVETLAVFASVQGARK